MLCGWPAQHRMAGMWRLSREPRPSPHDSFPHHKTKLLSSSKQSTKSRPILSVNFTYNSHPLCQYLLPILGSAILQYHKRHAVLRKLAREARASLRARCSVRHDYAIHRRTSTTYDTHETELETSYIGLQFLLCFGHRGMCTCTKDG